MFANRLTIESEKIKMQPNHISFYIIFNSPPKGRYHLTQLQWSTQPRKLRHDELENLMKDDNVDNEAEIILRTQYRDKFTNEGAVEWQNQAVLM